MHVRRADLMLVRLGDKRHAESSAAAVFTAEQLDRQLRHRCLSFKVQLRMRALAVAHDAERAHVDRLPEPYLVNRLRSHGVGYRHEAVGVQQRSHSVAATDSQSVSLTSTATPGGGARRGRFAIELASSFVRC